MEMKTLNKRKEISGFTMVCINKKKTGLPVNIWLDCMTKKFNKLLIQNNYSNKLLSENPFVHVIIDENIYIAGKTDIINIKNSDLQIVLKYISDNAGIFFKYFKDEIDDFDTLNLLYGEDGEKNVW